MNQIIEFCCKVKCPVVNVQGDTVVLGDANGPEGITTWDMGQFRDFVMAVHNGKFDHVISETQRDI